MLKSPTVGIALITHNAKDHLMNCLRPLLASKLKARILVVNSSSDDGTIEIARKLGVETLIVKRNDFNHGLTRELARKTLNTDIVIMMTPDAYASDNLLEKLIEPLLCHQASIAYARQVPHDGADFFESFHREYNYPSAAQIRGIEDIKTYGSYTFFCSNSCAAYLNKALDTIGGFNAVLLGEDTLAVAKLLKKGHKIAYVSNAIVKHSHRYSLIQEFRRHFDIGLARKSYEAFIKIAGKDLKRGKEYGLLIIKRLLQEKPYLIPEALTRLLVKFLGYRLGKASQKAPLYIKKYLSSQDFYWSSNSYKLKNE